MSILLNERLNYITLIEKESIFYKKVEFSEIYKELTNYKLYYKNLGGTDDSDYLKSCNFILNDALEEFYKFYPLAETGEKRKLVIDKYITPLTKTSDFESYRDLHEEVMKNPGITFGNLRSLINNYKAEGQEENYASLITCLLKKTLYYSIYNLADGKNPFDYNKVIIKTFSQFNAFNSGIHTGYAEIESNLDIFVGEIFTPISRLIESIKLMSESVENFSLSKKIFNYQSASKYIISTYLNYNYNSDKNYLGETGALNTLFEQAADEYAYRSLGITNHEYKTNLSADEIIKNINKTFIRKYANFPINSSYINNNEYESLAAKWLYHKIFYPNDSKNPKETRSLELILKNINIELKATTEQIDNLKQIFSKDITSQQDAIQRANIVYDILGEESVVFSEFKNFIKSSFDAYKDEVRKGLPSTGTIILDELASIKFDESDGKNKSKIDVKKITKKVCFTEEELNFYTKLKNTWKSFIKEYDSALKNGVSDNNYTVEELENYCLEPLNGGDFITEEDKENIENFTLYKQMISKFAFFLWFKYSKNIEKTRNPTNYDKYIYIYEESSFRDFGEKEYFYYDDIFDDLSEIVKKYFELKKKVNDKQIKAQNSFTNTMTNFYEYKELEKNILEKRACYEDDFFYIKDLNGKKVLPVSKYLDIDFITYDLEHVENPPQFVSVVKRIEPIDEKPDSLYWDNYFSSFEINDLGSEKNIKLILKSKDESNLEDIIYNSILGPVGVHNRSYSGTNTDNQPIGDNSQIQEMFELIRNRKTNFRVRFGYSEITESGAVIDDEELIGINFSSRTSIENKKPVIKSPWLYFHITDLKAKLVDMEFTFEIDGTTLGNSIINEYAFYNIDQKNPDIFVYSDINPSDSLEQIGKILYNASGGKICVMSDINDNEIVVSSDQLGRKKFTIKEGRKIIKKSEVGEIWTKGNINSNIKDLSARGKVRNMNLVSSNELKDRKISVKDILDRYMDWLPTKQYAVLKKEGKSMAVELSSYGNIEPTDDISIISLKPSYEVIDCNIKLESESKEEERSIIRIYYSGPSNDDESDSVRVYSYKFRQDSIVKNITINNEVSIGNIRNYCAIVGTGYSAVYASNYSLSKESLAASTGIIEVILSSEDLSSAKSLGTNVILVPKDSIVSEPINNSELGEEKDKDNESVIKTDIRNLAYSSMQNIERWPFEGTVEILGDPYFLADGSFQLGRNMIFLDINRISKINSAKPGEFLRRSYYTGLYYITDITHSFSADGDFTTKLKVVKYISK